MLTNSIPHLAQRIRHHAVAFTVALFCLAMAQPAMGATRCESLPGRSALDQYCETIPGATGDSSPGSGSGSGRHLSRGTERKLRASGAAGQALLGLSEGNGGGGAAQSGGSGTGANGGSGERSSRGSSSGQGDKAADEPSNNVLSAVRSAADSGSSSGAGFIWLLLVVALVIAGIAWARYRTRGRRS